MEGKKIGSFPVIILLIPLLVVSVLFYKLALGWYPAKYTESAHVRVNRSTISSIGYAVGHCAHCHEQHASIEGASHTPYDFALFAPNNATSQTDNFCFQCHKGTGSVQSGGIPYANDDYGSQFGGGTANSTNIKDAFNFGPPNQTWDNGSSHNLQKVRNWWKLKAGGDWVTTDTNACVVCHPPHYSQKNHDPYTTYKTAVRRPSHPDSAVGKPRNLWGDEAGSEYNEMMSEFTANYQAPYRVGKTTYEPAGNSTQDGSNLPNFVGFCVTCHNKVIPNAKTDANVGRDLYAIDWTSTGQQHGKNICTTISYGEGSRIEPYTQPDYNYVLSCTDCHEPHGSPNPFLLRTTVNGTNIGILPNMNALYNFCIACHVVNASVGNHPFIETQAPSYDCSQCHRHGTCYF